MHLMIASVSAATSPAGVCRHAANIARGMITFPAVRKVTLLVGDWQGNYFRDAFDLNSEKLEIKCVSIGNRPVARNLWYLRGLPAAAKACGADVVHLAYPMPFLRRAYTVPTVVSLHDLYPIDIPENFGKRAWLNRAALRLCLQNIDAIACVSEQTRSRLHQLFPAMQAEKTAVIPNSVYLSRGSGHISLRNQLRACPFLLCVAQHRANKNLPLLLRSFRLALDRNLVPTNTRLVLVGKEGPETQLLHKVIEQNSLEESVLFLRGITDALLLSLYENCELVIAPSLLEGFGLPVAEALAAGSRVACSDIPAFRAIDASHCAFFDPFDNTGESLLAAVEKVIKTPRIAAVPAAALDPRRAAAMYLALYSRLLLQKQTRLVQPTAVDLPTSDQFSVSIRTATSERRSL